MPADQIVNGALVEWQGQLAVVVAVSEDGDGAMAEVQFDNGDKKFFKSDSGQLTRVVFRAGSQVMRGDGVIGVVLEQVSAGQFPMWKVAFGGAVPTLPEMALRPAVIDDPIERMRGGHLGTAKQFNLRSVAADLWLAHRHSELVSLAHARIDLLPHQVSVVHRVVSNYPHRFMLCDEVGLGKTIEAAMIIKELRARGQAKRVLIVAPAGLQRQWQFELKTKFNESFAIYGKSTLRYLQEKGVQNPWTDHDSIITSHSWASWTPERRAEIASVPWDMVVVDEAHHARAQRRGTTVDRTNLYRLVGDLIGHPDAARRAVLLLTASPLQLEYHELYSLCEMLDPILFASEQDFREHVRSLAGLNQLVERLQQHGIPKRGDARSALQDDLEHCLALEPPEAAELLELSADKLIENLRGRHRLSEVLIRNRKSVVGGFMPRRATRWEVDLSPTEQDVHRLMEQIFEKGFAEASKKGRNAVGFQMVMLQKLLASSSRALLTSLEGRKARLAEPEKVAVLDAASATTAFDEDQKAQEVVKDLAPAWESRAEFDAVIDRLKTIRRDSKTGVLMEQLGRLFAEDGEGEAKVLIFSEFRETQEMLAEALAPLADVHLFHGQLSAEQKDRAIADFRAGSGRPQILVSTEAGGEGRNLQFCHYLVNYDLPWNPMKVEQRIGRLDRIRQQHTVSVFNFHVRGTIEGRILEVLERRIGIFEAAVGSLDPILGEAEADIRKALKLAKVDREKAIQELGKRIERDIAAARTAEEQRADFIMDAKSYMAAIVKQLAGGESPVTPEEFETFILALLSSYHTYIGPKDESGERLISFHPPLTTDFPDVVQNDDSRRVAFDPTADLDSQQVEYLGFGHPIVDRLVTAVTEERNEGAAAVRQFPPGDGGPDCAGWQFNYRIKIDGLRSTEFVLPVFVDDNGHADRGIGEALLRRSRAFVPTETTAELPIVDGLEHVKTLADAEAHAVLETEVRHAQEEASEKVAVERQRTEALFDRRYEAGQDRIDACRSTLARMCASQEAARQRVIPVWEANLRRAEAELEALAEDRERTLMELEKRGKPGGEVQLLNVARIVIAPKEDHGDH
ncbi:MAG TPA: helicase-related protein [Baekduia sp.]|nr:helicase-related protein [Baekduia sp.]